MNVTPFTLSTLLASLSQFGQFWSRFGQFLVNLASLVSPSQIWSILVSFG